MSINHNWLNGCNVDLSWEFVKSNLRDVQREISDCREMDHWGQQCQVRSTNYTAGGRRACFESLGEATHEELFIV